MCMEHSNARIARKRNGSQEGQRSITPPSLGTLQPVTGKPGQWESFLLEPGDNLAPPPPPPPPPLMTDLV